MLTATTLIDRLLVSRIVRENEILGCTELEIERVKETSGLVLPTAYIDFLRAVGNGAGQFLADVEIFYPAMMCLNTKASKMLKNWEGEELILPTMAYIFAMRRFEQFMYFVCDGSSENPFVYRYVEGSHCFSQRESFWDVVEAELTMAEEIRRECPNSPLLR